MSIPIADRRVLVTGASSGIGAATAVALLERGARVAGLARRHGRLAQVGGLLAVPADVSDPAAAGSGVDSAVTALGGLDVLINAAGVSFGGSIEDGDLQEWRMTFDVNVLGLLAITRAAIPALREGRAPLIINVSSMSGHRILSPRNTVYGASKHAVQAITTGLRKELAPAGIRVTGVSPSYVQDTEIHDHHRDPAQAEAARTRGNELGVPMLDFVEAMVYLVATGPEMGIRQLDLSATHQPD